MNLEEFTNLMSSFVYSDFPVRELPIMFNISMSLQVSELISERHYNMNFYEFLEAFCRVIDKASPIPEGDLIVKKIFFFNLILNYRKIGLSIKEMNNRYLQNWKI